MENISLSTVLTRQFNSGFFYPSGLSFFSEKYLFLEPNVSEVIFQGEFNELGFEAVKRLVIALKSQLRLSGVRITPSYKLKIKRLNFYLDKEHFL